MRLQTTSLTSTFLGGKLGLANRVEVVVLKIYWLAKSATIRLMNSALEKVQVNLGSQTWLHLSPSCLVRDHYGHYTQNLEFKSPPPHLSILVGIVWICGGERMRWVTE